ncbi:hypothetical protein EYZ11_002519 [Aspergillus tanneri]|uniref:Uncharacterized protein n=1 Tax=Aspergillus tanneri TaxID=1220188 RepID=A0A4S3JSY8_9EURO|nr:uncharacterized protein ATNIH1004_007352 [Aspergillus tanneri]KAA8645931.1 hypothetical protein ATNIH1004_007352 [Aspergillus tanneri]THC98017.1 hypothetical protein EYZ11_002519 [Aspergillus tanneri]
MLARSFVFRTLSQQCPRNTLSPGFYTSASTWRCFASSASRTKAATRVQPQASSKSTLQPKARSSSEETLKFAGRRPEGFGKLERKVAKEGQIVLFRAPSHRSYVLGAYGISAFCFAYSVYNSNIVFRDPIVPLPMWQQALFGGVCIMMSVMGTVFLFKTARLIKTVKVVSTDAGAQLRFTIRSTIPFRKPYEFDALPRQIAFSRRLVVTPESANLMQQGPAAPNGQSSDVSLIRAPLKKSSVLLWRLFRSVRQLFTQEDFVLLEVEGQKGVFRMDSAGYVSEDFLVIGNPLSVKR